MNDLFESINEIREERAAICEFDGLLTREQAEKQGLLESEQYRVACEVRKVLEMPLNERREYLAKVDHARGKSSGQELRAQVQAEWLRRKAV